MTVFSSTRSDFQYQCGRTYYFTSRWYLEIKTSFLPSILACWKCPILYINSIGHLTCSWSSRMELSKISQKHELVGTLKAISGNGSPKRSFCVIEENSDLWSCRQILHIYRQGLLRINTTHDNWIKFFWFWFYNGLRLTE